MIKFQLEGIEDVRRTFKQYDREFKKAVTKKVRIATNFMRDRMREATPVDSGALKKATTTSVRGYSGAVVIKGKPAWYFLVVNYGNEKRGLAGTEYAERTTQKHRPKAQEILAAGVDEVLRGG